jgi:hypothetical protein
MKKITIKIDTKNAAFEENPGVEVARILHELAIKFSNRSPDCIPEFVLDINGNKVGTVKIS